MNVELLGAIPDPTPTEDSLPYWEAAKQGRLSLQCCTGCGRGIFPPRPGICPYCQERLEWRDATGCSTVYSWAGVDEPIHDWLKPLVPFTIVIASLDELPDVRIPAFYSGDRALLSLQTTGSVVFQDVGREYPLTVFERT